MPEQQLLTLSKLFATEILERYPATYTFHNLGHTLNVARAAIEIGNGMKLLPDDLELVTVAAWFHDLGYLQGSAHHEMTSCNILTTKLREWKIADTKIEKISAIIMATKMPQNPQNLLAQVICDADLSHLAADDFFETSEGLRNEFSKTSNLNFEHDIDWWRFNLDFLEKHHYWTDYAKAYFTLRKHSNANKIKALLARQ